MCTALNDQHKPHVTPNKHKPHAPSSKHNTFNSHPVLLYSKLETILVFEKFMFNSTDLEYLE